MLEIISLQGQLYAKLLPELVVNKASLMITARVVMCPFDITSQMGAKLLPELVNRVPLVRA